jgi:hypothetical protein
LTNYCRICWRDVSRAQYLKNREKIAANYQEDRENLRAARAKRTRSSAAQRIACDQCGLTFIQSAGRTACLPCEHGRPITHGTCSTYGRGCRCRPCTDAASANAVRNRRRRFADAGLPDDSSYARRCRQYGGRYEFIDKLAVFDRDNWICQLCDKPVDKAAQWPDPFSASLDHRVPLSKGGDHLCENVQCSHLRCNNSKQNRS